MKPDDRIIRMAFAAAMLFILAGDPAMAAKDGIGALDPGTHKLSLAVDGKLRDYLLRLPPDRDSLGPLPLVFVLHGGGANAEK